MRVAIIIVLCAVSVCAGSMHSLGDLDGGSYNGPGTVDDILVEDGWRNSLIANYGLDPVQIQPFDRWYRNNVIAMTFVTAPTIATSAFLQVVMQASDFGVATDEIRVELFGNQHTFVDLGWLPLSRTSYEVRMLDLSNVGGVSYLGNLADGIFNFAVVDDISVDYAVLSINENPSLITPVASQFSGRRAPDPRDPPAPVPVPAPGALGLALLGVSAVVRKRFLYNLL